MIDSIENKQLLWGILSEEGVFAGIPSSKVNDVQRVFELTLAEMKSKAPASVPLKELNMHAIERLIVEIPRQCAMAQPSLIYSAPSTGSGGGGNGGILADDLHKTKQAELDIRLRAQEANMRSMLEKPKPAVIDFSDSTELDDPPLGDDMDKLIAETMAARERDLKMITEGLPVAPSSGSAVNVVGRNYATSSVKKTVSFSSTPPKELHNEDAFISSDHIVGVNDILKKFKRVTNVASEDASSVAIAAPTTAAPSNPSFVNEMLGLLREIKQNQQTMMTTILNLQADVQLLRNEIFANDHDENKSS